MARLFAQLAGFSGELLDSVPDAEARLLERLSLWGVAGTCVGAAVTGACVHRAIGMPGVGWLVGVVFGVSALCLQALLVAGSGVSLNLPRAWLHQWRPSAWRASLLFVLFLAFSQLALALYIAESTPAHLVERASERSAVARSIVEAHLASEGLQADHTIALVAEQLRALGVASIASQPSEALRPMGTKRGVDASPPSNRRLLLIVENPLSGPSSRGSSSAGQAAERLVREFTDAGFTTARVDNPDREGLVAALDRHAGSVTSRDISAIVFLGPVAVRDGTNYLVPRVVGPTSLRQELPLRALTDATAKRRPLANIIVVIDQSLPDAGGPAGATGPAPVDTVEDGLLVLARDVAPDATRRPRQESPIAAALTRHLRDDADIVDAFKAVDDELRAFSQGPTGLPRVSVIGAVPPGIRLAAPGKTVPTGSATGPQAVNGPCQAAAVAESATGRQRIACLEALLAQALDDRLYVDRRAEAFRTIGSPGGRPASGLDLYPLAWSTPLRAAASAFFTLVAIILMGGGLLWRELHPDALRAYEKSRYEHYRRFVQQYYRATARHLQRVARDVCGVLEEKGVALPTMRDDLSRDRSPFRAVPVRRSKSTGDEAAYRTILAHLASAGPEATA